MRTKFLPIFFGVVFALILFFAVAAGAQEERTITDGAGVQAVEVQQQQVPDNQQQILEVQQQQQAQNDQQQAVEVQQQQVLASQQDLVFAEGEQADQVQVAARESGPLVDKRVETRDEDQDNLVDVILIQAPNCTFRQGASFVLEDDDGTQADFIDNRNIQIRETREGFNVTSSSGGRHDPIVPREERGGDRTLDTGGLEIVTSTGFKCEGSDNDGGGGGGGGGGSDDLDCADFDSREEAQDELEEDRDDPHNLDADNDGQACEDFDYSDGDGGGGGGGDGDNNPVNVAQEDTSPDTTTSDLNAASPETTAADANLNTDFNRPDSETFRCDLFLRVVSDDRGALRTQYLDGRGDDELIVQRFEQCLSEDVLADTIPDRTLPFTGGMSLLFLGAIGLAAIVAGIAVLRAVMRRAR